MKYKTISCDVLVIGGGAAGLRAAIAATEAKVKVAIVSKEPFGKAHSDKAMGGINVAIKAPATPEQHYSDTVKGGWNVNNKKLVETFTREMPDRVHDLVSYGVKFDLLPDGSFYTWAGGKQSAPLNLCAGDYTGREMMEGLAREAARLKIPFYGEQLVVKLFTTSQGVQGALAFDTKKKEYIFYACAALIVATGGAGQLYKITSNEPTNTGEGYAWALDNGVGLVDMEFIQFHPTGMAYPEEVQGSLITEKVRGHKGKLFNTKGERFMERYQPERLELAGRDEVARAIYTEVQEGRGTKHGGVYLDVRELGKEQILKLIPEVYEKFHRVGVDISKEMMEITPTMHHVMGGIKINEWGETNIPGFFGAGEVTGGVHGANRLGGNSLAEGQVFGRRAGMRASEYAKKHKVVAQESTALEIEYNRIQKLLENKTGISYIDIRRQLKQVMWDNVGMVREAKGLAAAKKQVLKLLTEAQKMSSTLDTLQSTLETEQMVKVAQAIIEAALKREESRGAHFRSDFPETKKEWEKNIVVRKKNETIITEVVPTVSLS